MADSFLSALSSPEQPVPGGGAAAAHTALTGISLLEKIVRVEHQRYHDDATMLSFWKDVLDNVSISAGTLHQLRDEDGRCYMRLATIKSGGGSEKEISAALEQAIDCPIKIAEKSLAAMDLVLSTAKRCKNQRRRHSECGCNNTYVQNFIH